MRFISGLDFDSRLGVASRASSQAEWVPDEQTMRKAIGEARAANKRRILASLQLRPGSSARDVAAALGITPMSAARTLQEMERLDRSVVVCGQTEYRRRHNKGRRTIPTYRVAAPPAPASTKFPPWLECVDVSAWRRGLNGTR